MSADLPDKFETGIFFYLELASIFSARSAGKIGNKDHDLGTRSGKVILVSLWLAYYNLYHKMSDFYNNEKCRRDNDKNKTLLPNAIKVNGSI